MQKICSLESSVFLGNMYKHVFCLISKGSKLYRWKFISEKQKVGKS